MRGVAHDSDDDGEGVTRASERSAANPDDDDDDDNDDDDDDGVMCNVQVTFCFPFSGLHCMYVFPSRAHGFESQMKGA